MTPALAALADTLEVQARALMEQARVLRALGDQPAPRPDPSTRTRILSVAEAAEQLACSKSQVRRLVHEGELKVVRITKRAFRVAESDVASLVKRRSR